MMLCHDQKTLYFKDLRKIVIFFLQYLIDKALNLTVVHMIHKILQLFKQVFIYTLQITLTQLYLIL